MIDVDKQISFWRNSAEEDLAVARDLVRLNRIRHGLFFAHLALDTNKVFQWLISMF